MKISYNWLKQFIDTDKTPDQLSLILTNIGLEVESVEKIQGIPGGLEGLIIAEVKDCIQHPNADRLRVTKVNYGTGEDVQVVCGAPNVATGQKVILAPVGSMVHPNNGEAFKINKSKIRGEVSEGMICAEDEIGLGKSHDGIMVLAEDAPVGTFAKDYFKLSDDYVFEIGLTPNRADAASHLGVARDLAAYLRSEVLMPDVQLFSSDNHDLPIPVVVEDEESCPRYSSLTISGVEVNDSPDWLKEKLNAIGVRPINNIVDITNYVLHELGQPLHAFDAAKIKGGKVVVKKCDENTPFTTLDDVERKLSAADLMICNAEEPMCIAGVFGGAGSGISSNTKTVFLESAYFNPVSVRKTSRRHGLKTDASFRFERGTDPEITVYALKRAALLIKEVAGGNISSAVGDFYPSPIPDFHITVSYSNINRLIGKEISSDDVKSILKALQIKITGETEEGLILKVPTFKVDVTREVDIIEEILRIYGYDNVEIPVQVRASLNYSQKPDNLSLQHQVSELLTANGFNEILSNSLTSTRNIDNEASAVNILNPLSSDLGVMRQSLLYSGLEAITYNQNRRSNDLRFYEFGRVYNIVESGYKEDQFLSIFFTGAQKPENWNSKSNPSDFYNLKGIVDGLIAKLNILGLQPAYLDDKDFSYGITYHRGGKTFVKMGCVAASALKKTDTSGQVFYAELNWDAILKAVKNNKITYREVSKFPAVRRDLSMLLDKNITFGQLKTIAYKAERNLLKDVNVFDIYEGDKLPAGKKSYAMSFIIQDDEKTLNDKQIDSIMQKLILNFEKEAGAEIRK